MLYKRILSFGITAQQTNNKTYMEEKHGKILEAN